jgi:outer membrane protein insertion porin family
LDFWVITASKLVLHLLNAFIWVAMGYQTFRSMDAKLLHCVVMKNNSLTPYIGANQVGGTVYNKFTLELRYPVSLNPQAMVYGLAFLEAGNSTIGVTKWSPFDNYKSAGVGVRIFLPMFGLLGLDWGYGFDKVSNQPNASGSNFHFTIGQQFGN